MTLDIVNFGKALDDIAPDNATRWNRCKPDCGCDRNPSNYANCNCEGGCERGSANKRQMIDYVIQVNENMGHGIDANGYFTCPLSGIRTHYLDSEIDRVVGIYGYRQGNIVLVNRNANHVRGNWQGNGKDIPGLREYARAVYAASETLKPGSQKYATKREARNNGGYALKGVAAEILGYRYGNR